MELRMKSPNKATYATKSPSCDLEVSSGQSLSHHKRQYTPSEWQSKKAAIRELYLDNGLSLKKVMEVLGKEPHSFRPTARMYKKRLESWGYFKNCTERRVRTILHEKTVRGAVEKVDTFNRNEKDRSAQKITKYLSRKKMTLSELIASGNEGQVRSDTISMTLCQERTQDGSDAGPNPTTSQLTGNGYEVNCPYKPWAKVFRLIEELPSGATYQGDSFGYHLYIDIEEDRDCSPRCLCHHHDISRAFAFVVYKSSEKLGITFLSDSLHSELVTLLEPLDPPDLQLQNPYQQSITDGLMLLKHYHTLHNRLEILRSVSRQSQVSLALALEMELLVEGLLADGEVFKSMGFENLYERGFLDYTLWKKFQQQKMERDIQALDGAFYAVDDMENPIPSPTSNSIHDEFSSSQFPVESVENAIETKDTIGELTQFPMSDDVIGQNSIEILSFDEVSHNTESRHEILTSPVLKYVDSSLNGLVINGPRATNLQIFNELETESNSMNRSVECQLIEAAENGKVARVQLLLFYGANANSEHQRDGSLPTAARNRLEPALRLLLDRGEDVLSRSGEDTLLTAAVREGHEPVVRLLLDRSANTTYRKGQLLVEATGEGHKSVIQLLLDRGAGINARNHRYDAPLIIAARKGNKNVVGLLLDYGADLNLPGDCDNTPIAAAAQNGHEKVVRLLLDRGADFNATEYQFNVPLVAAARKGHEKVVRLLLDRGADPNIWDAYIFGTPLSAAAQNGHEKVVRLLLDRGADPNIWGAYIFDTPLSAAAQNGHEKVVRLLLDRGADVNARSHQSNDPLVAAAMKVHEKVAQLLLDSGADPNHSGLCLYSTPLSAAAHNGHEIVVRLLLDRGADKNTGIFYAAWAGDRAGKRELLHLGADINFALVGAARRGREDAVRQLLRDGADANAITRHGTALSAAAIAGNEPTIKILLEEGADVQTALCILQGLGMTLAAEDLVKTVFRPRDSAATALELRNLRLQFVHQYTLMIHAGQGSLQSQNLFRHFRNYRDVWAAGIKTMRGLCNGSRPETFYGIISFLCLARAIVENLGNSGHGEYLEDFLLDLNRWQELFRSNTEDFIAYREVVYSMWGVVLGQTEVVYEEALISFQKLASTLVHHANEAFSLDIFGNQGLERSQDRLLQRTSQTLSAKDQPTSTSGGRFYDERSTQQPELVPIWDPDPPFSSTSIPLKERMKDEVSSTAVEPMVILLMAGAVFTIVIVFLQVLRNISAGFVFGSIGVGGISSLPERYRVLENYLGLKETFVSGLGPVGREGGFFESFL